MANLDSRSKRASSGQIALPWVLAPVLPDGAIVDEDRRQSAHAYTGTPFPIGQPASRRYRMVWPMPIGPTNVRVLG